MTAIANKSPLKKTLDLQKDGHSAQNPLAGLFLCLEVEGPDEGGAAGLGLVDGAGVHVPEVLSVHWDGLDEDDRHDWGQLLQTSLVDHARLHVPPSTCMGMEARRRVMENEIRDVRR